jgi:cyclohexyl-isocyanide hydratase
MSLFNIGFIIFPDLTQLDFTGPLQVLSRLPQSATHIVAKSESPVPSDCGLGLVPTHTFANCPPLDLLCVPGGSYGVVRAIGDREIIEFVRRQAGAAKYVTSVCTGAFILGVAGLLKGRRATTHWAFTDLLPLVGATHEKARVVRDGNVITAGGVTSGIDFGLTVAAEMARQLLRRSSSGSNTTRRHRLIPVIPIGHRRLSNQRCYRVVTRRPGQRSAQALIRPPGSNRVSLLYARVSERVAGAASFPHSNRHEYGRSNLHNDHNEGVSDGLAVCDRGSDGPCSCNARLLHPINSESIMAGRRSFISRSTSHVPAGI